MQFGNGRNSTRLVLLAPSSYDTEVSVSPWDVRIDPQMHGSLMAELQRLRGRVYLGDGAIQATQVTRDGRHWQPADERSWHVLALSEGRVIGCARYHEHPNTISFERLGVRLSSLGSCAEWRGRLKAAVDSELAQARRDDLNYVEAGGWAIAQEHRGSREGLRIALATYGLAQLLGGCIGITTATARHGSADILCRLGGNPLEAEGETLPVYFDAQYGCDMEILRFDSRLPAPRYRSWVNELRDYLWTSPIIAREPIPGSWPAQLQQLDSVIRRGLPVFDFLPVAP
jgi:hypothetical protein